MTGSSLVGLAHPISMRTRLSLSALRAPALPLGYSFTSWVMSELTSARFKGSECPT